MRRDRGFTVLELGVVIGVIAILLAGIAMTTKGAFDNARAERTGIELHALLRVGADALKRNLVVQGTGTAGAPPTFIFRSTPGAMVTLDRDAPLCFDLSRGGGSRECPPDSGQMGPMWSGNFAALPLPANSAILAALGGTVQNNGFNGWCQPYVLCLLPRRVDVFTCVGADDVRAAGLQGSVDCGPCATPSPVTNEPTRCVMISGAAFSQASSRLRSSYSEALQYDVEKLTSDQR